MQGRAGAEGGFPGGLSPRPPFAEGGTKPGGDTLVRALGQAPCPLPPPHPGHHEHSRPCLVISIASLPVRGELSLPVSPGWAEGGAGPLPGRGRGVSGAVGPAAGRFLPNL